MTTDVEVFNARLENCETINLTYEPAYSLELTNIASESQIPEQDINVFKKWCLQDNRSLFSVLAGESDFTLSMGETRIIYRCLNGTVVANPGLEHGLLISVEKEVANNKTRYSGMLCRPTYSLTRRTVTNVTNILQNRERLHVSAEVKETLSLGTKPSKITHSLLNELSISSIHSDFAPRQLDSAWYALLNVSEPRSNILDWLNPSLVTEVSQKVWTAYAALAVRMDCTSTSNHTLSGTATSIESRLYAQELSLRLMEGIFAVLALFSIVLCLLSTVVFYRDLGSVGSHGYILGKSQALRSILADNESMSKDGLRSFLHGYTVSFPVQRIANDPAIIIVPASETIKGGNLTSHGAKDHSDESKWWQSSSATMPFRVVVFGSTLAVVVALEVLLQISKRNKGITGIEIDGYQKYAWAYIPTMVMSLIGLTFAMGDSAAMTLHPFQILRKGITTFKEMLYDPACQPALFTAILAAWRRHFVLLAIVFSTLLAPILTIVTSGLYTAAPVPREHKVTLQVENWLYLGESEPPNEDLTYEVIPLIQAANMPYPSWTNGGYAISAFGVDDLRSYRGNDTFLSLNVRAPAVRARFNCSLTNYWENLIPSEHIVSVDPPAGCNPLPFVDGNGRTRPDSQLHLVTAGGSVEENGYSIYILDHGVFPMMAEDEDLRQTCGDDRYHFWFLAGCSINGTSEESKGFNSATLIHCNPYIDALYVTANISLPSLQVITSASQVVPDEDSAVILSNALSYMGVPFEVGFSVSQNLITGIGAVPIESLVGKTNAGNLITRLEHVYGIYMAQILHTSFQPTLQNNSSGDIANWTTSNPATAHFVTDPINGTLRNGSHLRMMQNAISTRIPQGVLATMLMCGVIACVLEGETRILPRDPGSIVAKMSLLADGAAWSKLEEEEGVEDGEGNGKMMEDLFKGWVFRMGWWNEKGECVDKGADETEKKRFGIDGTRVSVTHDSAV